MVLYRLDIEELKLDDYVKDAAIAIATDDMKKELIKILTECGINATTVLGKD